jgi:hypothetical protein
MVQLTGTFSDPDVNDPHSVIIDWADGSPQTETQLTIGQRDFALNHLYTNGQAAQTVPQIRVIVTDQAFASSVSATSGTFDGTDFRNPQSVLGEPTRFTSPTSPYGGAVTPFNPAFGGNELLSLHQGESVTVKFPVQVFDNASSSHHGADFIVFGNAFYVYDFGSGTATGSLFDNPGTIEVSQDGVNFFPITSSFANTAFPTNAYRNPTGPFDLPPASAQLSDFGLPVDVNFNVAGLNLSQIEAAYNGSGGGTPVDISSTGLPWIQYVRINGAATGSVNLDALSVVDPLPPAVAVGSFGTQQLDATLGLHVDAGGFYQGYAGADAKWLRGQPNAFGNSWYFLRSNGEFVAWDGMAGTNGTVLYRFDPQVFLNPETLYQAANSSLLSAPDLAKAQSLDGTLGLYVDAKGFFENFGSGGAKWLRGQPNAFGSSWYFLRSNGDFVAWDGMGSNSGTVLYQFSPQVFLNPDLLYQAATPNLSSADAAQAQQLDATLGLHVDAGGFYQGYAGADAKWLRGQPNASGNSWYFLRSNGEFVAWDGMAGTNGTVLYHFDPQVFLNPETLYRAAAVSLPAGQMVQAQQYNTSLGLYVDARGLFEDSGVKWLRGQPNLYGNSWYFLRSTGEFVAWDGMSLSSGTVLYQFDPQVYLNPDVLL